MSNSLFQYRGEPVKDAATMPEMRAEIFRLSHYDALCRSIRDTADYTGMSAEDRYTMLAYHALKERAKFRELCIEFNATNIKPMFIPDKQP